MRVEYVDRRTGKLRPIREIIGDLCALRLTPEQEEQTIRAAVDRMVDHAEYVRDCKEDR